MTWQILASRWLIQGAIGGIIVLALGSLAVRLCRQPVRKARLAVLTLICALSVPWLGALPIAPRWSAPILPAVTAITPVEKPTATASLPIANHTFPRETTELRPPSAQSGELVSTPKVQPAISRPVALAEPSPPTTSLVEWIVPILLALYVAATTALVAWWLLGQAVLYRTCRNARPVSEEVRSAFLALSGPDGAGVRLLESDQIALPFTFTWSRPVILLPSELCRDAEGEALRYCLAHEWSHVERRDSWAWNLASVASFTLFYQPLFWWLRRQLRLCQDFLADDRAAGIGSPEDYAAYLVELARCRLVGTSLPALGIGDRRSNLHRRIVMLVEDRPPLQRHCRMIWTAGAAIAASITVLIASGLRLDAAPQDPPKVEEKAADNAKDKEKAAPKADKAETLNYSGTVKDKDTGKPIEGAIVTVRRSILKGSDNSNRILEESKHKTDAQGKYAFTIPADQVAERFLYIELDVEHPDYATQAGFGYALSMILKNEKMGGRPFFENIELRPGKPLNGRVQTPEGKPAVGTEILAYSVTTKKTDQVFEYGSFFKTKSDDKGEFHFVATTPGHVVFWILPKDAAPEAHRVPDDKRGDLGLFVLQPGIAVRGRVLDAKGKPVTNVYVNVERGRQENSILEGLNVADAIARSAVTDAKGEFAVAPLPAGSYLVKPGGRSRDSQGGREAKPMTDVFLDQKLTLKDGETPEPLEIRAAPHVTIEAQWLDGKGKPTRGFSHHIFGQIDGGYWMGEAQPDNDGKVVARVPHGMENVQFGLMTNEHGAIKFRTEKGGPLQGGRQIRFASLDHDVKGIEIIRYTAPILMVKGQTKNGKVVPGLIISADYGDADNAMMGKMILAKGVQSDVSFEVQEDGRHRSSQLSPDREVTVKAQADGFQPASTKVKLPEGETKDIVLTLEPK